MKRYFLVATLACVGTGSMAINAQQGRMAQIVPPQATVHRQADIPLFTVNELIQARSVRSQTVILSQTFLKAGAMSPRHNHPEESETPSRRVAQLHVTLPVHSKTKSSFTPQGSG